jgi:signal transduction histidine kinase
VGPQLAALTLKLEPARRKLAADPDADALLSDLGDRTRAAVADIRRAVYALRPPALDEFGLVRPRPARDGGAVRPERP